MCQDIRRLQWPEVCRIYPATTEWTSAGPWRAWVLHTVFTATFHTKAQFRSVTVFIHAALQLHKGDFAVPTSKASTWRPPFLFNLARMLRNIAGWGCPRVWPDRKRTSRWFQFCTCRLFLRLYRWKSKKETCHKMTCNHDCFHAHLQAFILSTFFGAQRVRTAIQTKKKKNSRFCWLLIFGWFRLLRTFTNWGVFALYISCWKLRKT